MFCENCGAKNDGDAKFCDNCGAAVGGEGQAAPAARVPEPAYAQSEKTYPPAGPAHMPQKKRSVKKIIGFTALGLVLVAGIYVGAVLLKAIADSKPATTTAEVVQAGKLPEDIASVDLTGRWYMLLSYYTVVKEGVPSYLLYKLRLDVKRDIFGKHDAEVTTITASYNNEHKDYPGDGAAAPDISGKALIGGAGEMMYFFMRDKSNPYPHVIDFSYWEVVKGKYIQSILSPLYDQQGSGELYPFGYIRSEDSEDYIWH